jgi:hypothetical protein
MKSKEKKTIMQELREIRDKISEETMDMSFEELKEYLALNSKIHDGSVWKSKYKSKSKSSLAAEFGQKYEKK